MTERREAWPENDPGKVIYFDAKGRRVERPRTERENIQTAEMAYRRGYQQGAQTALMVLADLLKRQGRLSPIDYFGMQQWVGVLLWKRRYGKDQVSAVPPPAPAHLGKHI